MVYRFDNCLLDVARRELRRDGACVPVEPQVFDLIHFLIRNRDRVVSKHDLVASVWGGRPVSDSALTSRIAIARRALGDHGDVKRYIRTFARKGIRFIGQVSENQSETEPTRFGELPAGPPGDAGKPAIAVLPFANLTTELKHSAFVEGMMEEIATALTRIRAVFVLSPESSRALKALHLAAAHRR